MTDTGSEPQFILGPIRLRITHPEIPTWHVLWSQIERRAKRLRAMYSGDDVVSSTGDVQDEVDALLLCLDHLKDWIHCDTKYAPGITNDSHLNSLFNHDPLMLCRDYANTFKHHTRSKITARVARLSETGMTADPGVTVRIQYWDKDTPSVSLDALDFVESCIEAWVDFFRAEGTPLPAKN